MKKYFNIFLCTVLLFFGTFSITGSSVSAKSHNIKLTPEQEKQVEEIVKEWERYNQIVSNNELTEKELERLFSISVGSTDRIRTVNSSNTKADEIVIANKKEDVDVLNEQLKFAGQPLLPEGTVSVVVQEDNTFIAETNTGEQVILPMGFWNKAWQATKCAAHLTLLVVPGTAAFRAIKSLGGIKKTAQLLVGAGNAKDFAAIAGGAASAILGLDGVYDNCFKW